jgi:hypothetical protein
VAPAAGSATHAARATADRVRRDPLAQNLAAVGRERDADLIRQGAQIANGAERAAAASIDTQLEARQRHVGDARERVPDPWPEKLVVAVSVTGIVPPSSTPMLGRTAPGVSARSRVP